MAPRRAKIGEGIKRKAKKKSLALPWKKDIEEYRKCQPKGPPQMPSCSHLSGKLQCRSLSQEDVERFHKRFYQTRDRWVQDSFLVRHCEATGATGRRAVSAAYFVSTSGGGRVRVCRTAWAGALGLKGSRVDRVLRLYKEELEAERRLEAAAGSRRRVTFAESNQYRTFDADLTFRPGSVPVPVADPDSISSNDEIFNNTFNITTKNFRHNDLPDLTLTESTSTSYTLHQGDIKDAEHRASEIYVTSIHSPKSSSKRNYHEENPYDFQNSIHTDTITSFTEYLKGLKEGHQNNILSSTINDATTSKEEITVTTRHFNESTRSLRDVLNDPIVTEPQGFSLSEVSEIYQNLQNSELNMGERDFRYTYCHNSKEKNLNQMDTTFTLKREEIYKTNFPSLHNRNKTGFHLEVDTQPICEIQEKFENLFNDEASALSYVERIDAGIREHMAVIEEEMSQDNLNQSDKGTPSGNKKALTNKFRFSWSDPKTSTPKTEGIKPRFHVSYDWSDPSSKRKMEKEEGTQMNKTFTRKTPTKCFTPKDESKESNKMVVVDMPVENKACRKKDAPSEAKLRRKTSFLDINQDRSKGKMCSPGNQRSKRGLALVSNNLIGSMMSLSVKETPNLPCKHSTADKENVLSKGDMNRAVSFDRGLPREKKESKTYSKTPGKKEVKRRLGRRNRNGDTQVEVEDCKPAGFTKMKLVL